jgi:hypothetical protein
MESVPDKAPEKKALTTLKLFNFFSFGSIAILYTFFPLYFAEQGLSKQVGSVIAIFCMLGFMVLLKLSKDQKAKKVVEI